MVLDRCRKALDARGIKSYAEIARRLGLDENTIGKIFNGRRAQRLQPEFVRALGELAGLPVHELFRTLGWLPPQEPFASESSDPGHDAGTALSAPLAAARALEDDLDGEGRFEVRLAPVDSGGRYRMVTNVLAEFTLRPGIAPLSYAQAERLALAAGLLPEVGDWPGGTDDHAAIRLELMARMHRALRDGQEYSWQGDPDHRTWRPAAARWPTHLLVQDAVAGQQIPAGLDPWSCAEPRTIVIIGGRHGVGPAAALLAEALGWQFVLVRPNTNVTGTGDVRTVPVARAGDVRALPPDGRPERIHAWIQAALHTEQAHREGRPWRAVILVRPAAFETHEGRLHPYAADLLRTSPARVVYARPPWEYLYWWGNRVASGRHPEQDHGRRRAERQYARYVEIEKVLNDRLSGDDLLLRIPTPYGELPAHVPEIPDEVVDQTVRVTWAATRWLAETTGVPVLPRPGRLASWRALLDKDPIQIPRLTELG
ncbi:helix-turn-helix domain-containing protein [Actinomadura scrupuli]|uniref:helix-turn-helix domain-containing protein n=1 Tax=Actinomadura scrupuli TaxID=559629 RepID=UPI003D968B37